MTNFLISIRRHRITWLKWLLIPTLLISLIFLIYIYANLLELERFHPSSNSFWRIQPPKPTADQMASLKSINWTQLSKSNDSSAKFNGLELISAIIQGQIKQLLLPTDCDQLITLKCGHNDGSRCGFGCQVHHRIACLITSYSLGIPLIHDEITRWPFNDKWSDVFRPLGSSCRPGPNTFTSKWRHWKETPLIYRRNCYFFCPIEIIDYPLVDGLPAPTELANLVELVHEQPWLWWISQFMKYGLKLREEVASTIEADKIRIGLVKKSVNRPLVGFHIRRTDKIAEANDSVHPLEQYFQEGAGYYGNQKTKSVFIASDDHGVLEEAIQKYKFPEWNVYRFPANITHRNIGERKNDLYSILRDLIVLAEECDYIVCGYSSNICRLLLEMFSWRFLDPWKRIKSLDGKYVYKYTTKSMPQKVLKY